MSDLSLYLDVLDPLAVVYAIAAGVAFGSTFLLWITLEYPSKVFVSAKMSGLLVATIFGVAGLLFFAGQIFQAYTSGDPLWVRALGRATLWLVFTIGIAFGLAIARSFAHKEGE